MQYGSERCEYLKNWLLDSCCEDFRGMHDWAGWPRSPLDGTSEKILSECDQKIYALSVLGCIGSISAPDKATLKAEAHALLCTTAGPYNAIPNSLQGVGPCVGLVLTWLVPTPSASRPAVELPRVRTRSAKAFRRFRHLESMTLILSLRYAPSGKRNF